MKSYGSILLFLLFRLPSENPFDCAITRPIAAFYLQLLSFGHCYLMRACGELIIRLHFITNNDLNIIAVAFTGY